MSVKTLGIESPPQAQLLNGRSLAMLDDIAER